MSKPKNKKISEYKTKRDVLERAQQAIGIPLRDIDKTGRIATGKGALGSIIEESWFGYSINSKSRPDFEEAAVELKVAPYVYKGKGLRAKERLVCNIINYMEEYKKTFYTSSFWEKCNTILLMSYEHKDGVPKGDFTIDAAILFSFPEEDLIIIEQDWEHIVNKIRAGRAHEISEGDTLYLGACTKGANASSVRKQPFSSIPAKQRAYSLKQSYMTYILNSYVFGFKEDERVIKDSSSLKTTSFEEIIIRTVQPYIGKTQRELISMFSIDSSAKNINELILAKILGVKGRISKTAEFQKAGIVPKTIRINHNGSITESMSFPIFEFKKIIQEEWETSEFKDYLEQTKFLFVVFKFDSSGELIFDKLLFWNIPEKDLHEVGVVWQRTVDIIKTGVILREKKGRITNNFPKKGENRVAHVRPHAKDSSDTLELPDGRMMPKQCFWLNNSYIKEQIDIYRRRVNSKKH